MSQGVAQASSRAEPATVWNRNYVAVGAVAVAVLNAVLLGHAPIRPFRANHV